MNRSLFVKTLEAVKPALASTNMVPIFQCFTFQGGNVSAYNDTIAIVGPSEFEENCGVNGNTLLGLLSNSSSDEIEFDLTENNLNIKLGKTNSKLPYEAADSFIFEEPTEKWDYSINFVESFHAALSLCIETVSNDETQAALHGVTIKLDKLFSCNGDTITRVQLKQGGKYQVLMPTPFCSAVLKLWSTMEITKGKLHFSKEWVCADFGEWRVYGRLLEMKDPLDFDDLIKRTVKEKTDLQLVPDGFSDALSRARVLADVENTMTQVTISKLKMKLHTETHQGEIVDELPFKGHPEITAKVNAAHLQSALKHCDMMAIHENCVVLEKGADVLLLVSNMG